MLENTILVETVGWKEKGEGAGSGVLRRNLIDARGGELGVDRKKTLERILHSCMSGTISQ